MRTSADNLSHPDDANAGSRWWPVARAPRGIALLALCLLVYLPGLWALPAVDRDESRFAQASRQMFESVALPAAERDPALHGGGVIVPRVQGKDRLNKPPLIYWLQACSAAAFTGGETARDAIWMYRVPSVLAAIIAVLATWRLGRAMFGPGVGMLAAMTLAVCPVVAWEARQARADMLLLACTTVALASLWQVVEAGLQGRRAGWGPVLGFWVAMALGILAKGPITPMVVVLALLGTCIVTRRWRWVAGLRPIVGLVLVAAMVVPWLVAVGERVGWDRYVGLVVDETLGRSVAAKEGHWGPPGYHLALLVLLFWPGSLLTGWAVVRGLREVRCMLARRADVGPPETSAAASTLHPTLFCLAWALPAWIVLEIVGTKLPHYTLPLYPALALLSARLALAPPSPPMPRLARHGVRLWMTAGLLLALAPLAVVLVLDSASSAALGISMGGLPLLAAALVLAWRTMASGRWGEAMHGAVMLMGGWLVWLFALLPRLDVLWTTRAIAGAVGQPPPRLATCDYDEDSLAFLARGRLDRVAAAEGAAWLATHPDGVLIAPAEPMIPGSRRIDRVRGFNYSKGRWVDLGLFVAEPLATPSP
ncbi:MAG: glycosyltransferase family 39 protein [Phycisphaerae bacterium]|nr:glycosyltransferase family 39 protein [Phycisphaerae bacterium]